MDAKDRYVRQIAIEGWGKEAQERLEDSCVCVVGAGGLGSPVSIYLAAAGVGSIILCDHQNVEMSNLNRQILYVESDIGHAKTECARTRLSEFNRAIKVETHQLHLDESSVKTVCGPADLIIDCLDDFPSRYILNRYSVTHGVSLIHAAIREFYGQIALLHPPHTPCLECFIPKSSPKDEGTPPVLGATAGAVGSLQALIAINALCGRKEAGYGILRSIDLLTMSLESVLLEKNPSCPACSG
jgi:molybdopterin-synthase adenylyltransferase